MKVDGVILEFYKKLCIVKDLCYLLGKNDFYLNIKLIRHSTIIINQNFIDLKLGNSSLKVPILSLYKYNAYSNSNFVHKKVYLPLYHFIYSPILLDYEENIFLLKKAIEEKIDPYLNKLREETKKYLEENEDILIISEMYSDIIECKPTVDTIGSIVSILIQLVAPFIANTIEDCKFTPKKFKPEKACNYEMNVVGVKDVDLKEIKHYLELLLERLEDEK